MRVSNPGINELAGVAYNPFKYLGVDIMLKKALKSRTVWLGISISTLGVVQNFVSILPVTPLYQSLVSVIVGVIIVILRFDTDDAIKDK